MEKTSEAAIALFFLNCHSVCALPRETEGKITSQWGHGRVAVPSLPFLHAIVVSVMHTHAHSVFCKSLWLGFKPGPTMWDSAPHPLAYGAGPANSTIYLCSTHIARHFLILMATLCDGTYYFLQMTQLNHRNMRLLMWSHRARNWLSLNWGLTIPIHCTFTMPQLIREDFLEEVGFQDYTKWSSRSRVRE